MDDVIKRIKGMISLRGMSTLAAEEAAGLKRGHLNNLLSGKRSGMSAATLLAIARALNVTTDWVLTGEGPMERPVTSTPPPSSPPPSARPRPSRSEPLQLRAVQRAEHEAGGLKKDLARPAKPKVTRQR